MILGTHPLLEASGIDDAGLALEFLEVGYIPAPGLTFRYSPDGDLGIMQTAYEPLCEDAPERFRRQFIEQWTEDPPAAGCRCRTGEECWERLKELVEHLYRKLPDNPPAQGDAWLVGLVSDMPWLWRQRLDGLEARIAEYQEEKSREVEAFERARRTGEKQLIAKWITGCCRKRGTECSGDCACEYAMPTGERRVEYYCTF